MSHDEVITLPSRGPKPEALSALFSDEEIDRLLAALAHGRDAWEEDAFNTAFAGARVWAQRTRVNVALLRAVLDGILAITAITRSGEPEFVGMTVSERRDELMQ